MDCHSEKLREEKVSVSGLMTLLDEEKKHKDSIQSVYYRAKEANSFVKDGLNITSEQK